MRLTAVLLLALALAPVALAQPRPPLLERVAVDEHVGAHLPFELWFSDAAGGRVQLGEVFSSDKPVLLALTYVRCRMLCSLVLRGVTDAVRDLPLQLGRDYRIVTVSIDPHEDAASAAARRRELLARVGTNVHSGAWTYLVGAERPIRELADRLGFHYAWDPRTEQYAHPAVIFVLTPSGRISSYLHGVQYPRDQLAAALRSAGAEELRPSSAAEAVLACFRFDPAARAHRESIDTYLRVGGTIVMLSLASFIAFLFAWERRRSKR